MIDSAISHISDQLNQFLKRNFDLTEDVVVVSNILEQDGTVASNVTNKVVMFLVNIEKETVPCHSLSPQASNRHRELVTYPPVHLNLYLMFAGNFSGGNYQESLKFISNTVAFFQGRPVFDRLNTPDLDRGIEKLTMEIENLDLKDLSTLWGVLSGKYLPSILYKVRMVTIDSGDVKRQETVMTRLETSVNS